MRSSSGMESTCSRTSASSASSSETYLFGVLARRPRRCRGPPREGVPDRLDHDHGVRARRARRAGRPRHASSPSCPSPSCASSPWPVLLFRDGERLDGTASPPRARPPSRMTRRGRRARARTPGRSGRPPRPPRARRCPMARARRCARRRWGRRGWSPRPPRRRRSLRDPRGCCTWRPPRRDHPPSPRRLSAAAGENESERRPEDQIEAARDLAPVHPLSRPVRASLKLRASPRVPLRPPAHSPRASGTK